MGDLGGFNLLPVGGRRKLETAPQVAHASVLDGEAHEQPGVRSDGYAGLNYLGVV